MVPRKKDVPSVPITANEIIEQTHQAFELGITSVHIHARLDTEEPTHKVEVYEKILTGIRLHCPELVICTSLSGRGGICDEQRAEVLTLKPDLASLTLSSLNFPGQISANAPKTIKYLINAMNANGVVPELEVFDPGMINYAKYLVSKDLLSGPLYFNLLFGNIAGTQVDLAYIGTMIKDLPVNAYWALAGIGNSQLKANTIAIVQGGGVRVGLEDNIWFDQTRKRVATNMDLLTRIHSLAETFERPIMSAKTFGDKGFYNKQFRCE